MKFILFFLLFTLHMSASPRADTLDYTFEMTKEQNATLYFNIETYNTYVEVGNKRINVSLSEKLDKDFIVYALEADDNISLFTFDDVNFDGYADIGLLNSYGITGNMGRIYYVYQPSKMRYEVYPYEIANLELFPKERLLYSHILGGLGWTKLYKIDAEGMPYEMMEILFSYPKEEEADFIVETRVCNTTIKALKVHFYKHPAIEIKKSYLIKGDSIDVVDFAMLGDGTAWAEVEYKGTKKIFKGWMRMSDIRFKSCPVKFSATVKEGVEKSYLYDKKNGKKTTQYVVMYDQIEVLKKDSSWLKGRFRNDAGKETVGWLKESDFEIERYIECCPK